MTGYHKIPKNTPRVRALPSGHNALSQREIMDIIKEAVSTPDYYMAHIRAIMEWASKCNIKGISVPVMYSTPKRLWASAKELFGSEDDLLEVPYPIISLYVGSPTFDAQRRNMNPNFATHLVWRNCRTEDTNLYATEVPLPYTLPFYLDVWSRYREDHFTMLEWFMRDSIKAFNYPFHSTNMGGYLTAYIGGKRGSYQFLSTITSIEDTSDLEMAEDTTETYRFTVSLEALTYMYDKFRIRDDLVKAVSVAFYEGMFGVDIELVEFNDSQNYIDEVRVWVDNDGNVHERNGPPPKVAPSSKK